eukprot:TRINITY_DN6558_c0_g1_i1.p1 TRINITY_DN6558_c0_g1~~TRINITY_DN6558_c0_g1_i1.p1  ORF type:complete len:295 (-),score=55.32 TRINITY_DN6558_c0_g1_i1:33-917(-)
MSQNTVALAHSLAGAGAGVISLAITYPLMIVVAKLQVKGGYSGPVEAIQEILKKDGWAGLFTGMPIALVGNAYGQAVYYYWYAFFKAAFEGKGDSKKNLGPMLNLVIGTIAGIITVFFNLPFWVVTTRMQTRRETTQKLEENKKPKNVTQTVLEVYKDSGFQGFWSGLFPSLILVSNPAIQYMVYEEISKIVKRKTKLESSHVFIIGAIAKTISTILTYPCQTVKTRLQSKQKYNGFADVLLKIPQEGGASGLFKGMESKIVQSVLTSALLFVFQDRLFKLIVWVYVKMFAKKA